MLTVLSNELAIFSLGLMFLLALTCGCSPDYVKPGLLVEIQGEVYLEKQPISNARVLFVPEDVEYGDEFEVSCGTTNTQGEFELLTRDGREGAIVGKHRVYISRANETGKPPVAGNDLLKNHESTGRLVRTNDVWGVIDREIVLAPGERVPFYYNLRSDLFCDVIPGRGIQRIRFDLSSIDPLLVEE